MIHWNDQLKKPKSAESKPNGFRGKLFTGGALASSGDTSETTFFNGSNQNAYFFKKCSMVISRYNGSLVLVSVSDNKNVYNIWMKGQELSATPSSDILYVNGSIALDHKNRDSGFTIYSTHKVAEAGKNMSYALELKIDPATKKFVRFELRHFTSKVLNHIDCVSLD